MMEDGAEWQLEMKPETAWFIVGGIGGGLVGCDLLPSVTSLVFMGALAAWLVVSGRRDRLTRTVETADSTPEGRSESLVMGRVGISPAMRILAGGILGLAIGVAGHLMDVW